MRASASSLPAGSGCSTSVTPASAQAARLCSRLSGVQASLASTISSEFGRGLAHRRDPRGVAVAAELDLEQRPVRGLGGCRRHRLRRRQRDRVGGGAGARRGAAEQGPDPLAGALGLEVQQRAIQRVAGGARRHRGLQGLPVEPAATAVPASPEGRPASLPASRRSAGRARIRRARSWPPWLTSATTVTASVLAPRLIVKEPAIGQRSMRAASCRDRLEVILKSGNFLNRKLARRNQLWLVRDRFYKAVRRAGPYLLHGQRAGRGMGIVSGDPTLERIARGNGAGAVRGRLVDGPLCAGAGTDGGRRREARRQPAQHLHRRLPGLEARHLRRLADRAAAPQPDPGRRRGQDRRACRPIIRAWSTRCAG